MLVPCVYYIYMLPITATQVGRSPCLQGGTIRLDTTLGAHPLAWATQMGYLAARSEHLWELEPALQPEDSHLSS